MVRQMDLYDLVKEIREQFKKIANDPEIKDDPLFELRSLELELNVVISKAAKGGLNFLVVTTGGSYEKEKISKIKLVCRPILRGLRLRESTFFGGPSKLTENAEETVISKEGEEFKINDEGEIIPSS